MRRIPNHAARAALVSLLVAATPGPALAGARYATSDSGSEQKSDAYRQGQRALESENWDEASRIFSKIAAGKGPETDAALYWKAYADWKVQRKKEAVEGLRQLLSSYPKSAWADDAKALELEMRGSKGYGGSSAQDIENEELKLYALDGLMHVDPDKAVPVLEKLLASDASPRIQERALFVLSQGGSPRAREILVRTGKTGSPEMRRKAIQTLGIAGDTEALASIAKDTTASTEIREAVVDAYIITGESGELLAIAKSDPDPDVRRKAINALGAIGGDAELRQLWATEKDPDLKAKLLESFGIAGDVEFLAKAARETSDPRLRRKAIEGLAITHGPETSKVLRELYTQFTDPADKKKILEGFMIHGDSETLVELFRAEKDPALKKAIVQQLSIMGDTRIILEILGEKP
jgi:HEAT repeat protein